MSLVLNDREQVVGVLGANRMKSRRRKYWTDWRDLELPENAPRMVCLCGSTRFPLAFQQASLEQTLLGAIVLTIGASMKSDTEHFAHLSNREFADVKVRLDQLHLYKIDLADDVMILNVGGYIGRSTERELAYALRAGKSVRFLEPVTQEYLRKLPTFTELTERYEIEMECQRTSTEPRR